MDRLLPHLGHLDVLALLCSPRPWSKRVLTATEGSGGHPRDLHAAGTKDRGVHSSRLVGTSADRSPWLCSAAGPRQSCRLRGASPGVTLELGSQPSITITSGCQGEGEDKGSGGELGYAQLRPVVPQLQCHPSAPNSLCLCHWSISPELNGVTGLVDGRRAAHSRVTAPHPPLPLFTTCHAGSLGSL